MVFGAGRMLGVTMVEIRRERAEDIVDIREVNERAFGQPQEADIVDKLRDNCEGLLSLVAMEEGKIVGHILFSPATIEGGQGVVNGMGLAPMTVLPEMQCRGIGTQLVRTGIQYLKKMRCPFVIVIGHPEYYPRFGFEPGSRYGIESQWEGVPDDAFMILWLDRSMANQVTGIAKYRAEFSEAD